MKLLWQSVSFFIPLMLACPGVQEMVTVVFLFSKCCICCLISATVCLCCVGCHPNSKMPIADWLSEKICISEID